MNHSLRYENFELTATDLGAELLSVKYNGRERLWQNGNGAWQGHAPVLFPVCGACAMRVGGTVYPCPKHGIAKSSRFTLYERTESSLRYRLTSDERTRAAYPFDFTLDVVYRIERGALSIAYEVRNPSASPLSFSCGGHDSFALEDEPNRYELLFEKEERFESLLTDDDGFLTGETLFMGEGKTLDLDTFLLDDGNSVCFDKLRSRGVLLRRKETKKAVAEVRFPQSEKLVLWRPHGAKMLCVEPWQNFPDREGETEEFATKDGVIEVPPYGNVTVTRTIRYE